MPDGQYALMASFDYSDELKSHFYRGSQDRNLTRLFLKERWPTAEILWQDFSDVSLQLVEAEVRDAENFVNSSLAEAHEKSGLFPSSITFQVSSENRLNSESHYSLVIDRGHIPEIYRYQIDGAEFSPEAYIMENRLGGLAVSLFLSAIVLILIQLLSPLGRFLRAIGPRLPGDLDGHK